MTGQKPREIAVRVLRQRRTSALYVENLLEAALAEASLSGADRALCQQLVYGVVRWQATLDWLIARKTAGRTQKPALQDLLRLGLFQIFWLDRIPDHAAVNETVELARKEGHGRRAGFVNAVLRGYLREAEVTRSLLAELKLTQPSLAASHPSWLVERWQQRWGNERARQLLDWNNTPPKTYARLNTLRVEVETLLAQWRAEKVEYDFFGRDWIEENLVFELKSHPPLLELPSFQRGWFYVQDPSTLLAVRELDPRPGEVILDFCAAPGGKTTYIAQRVRNSARVVAQDLGPDRLNLIRMNCERLGVTCVGPLVNRESKPRFAETSTSEVESLRKAPPSNIPREFDRVLLDAPCSNTGVLRRRVDLRWRLRLAEIHRLAREQLTLLREAARRTRPGGTLVYSTCSLEPEENQKVVQQFLAGQPCFKLQRERELLPFADGVDGAYVARMIRT